MPRAARAAKAAEGVEAEQLRALAFNVCGFAMHDGMKKRQLNESIVAYEKSATPYKDAIKSLSKNGEAVYRTSIEYTDRELGPRDVGLVQYIVVGYIPREVKPEYTKKASFQKNQQPVGVVEPPEIIAWNDAEPPLLVVTEVLNSKPDAIQLWALLRPRQGLCTPYQVAQSIVFYRHEFRDLSTAIRDRCTNWNKLVAAQSFQPGNGTTPTAKQEKYKKARDTSKVILEPKMSFANEILCLVTSFKSTKNPWFLRELMAVLVEMDEDIQQRPLATNAGLRKFVEIADVDFNEDDAEAVIADAKEQWPELQELTKEKVLSLRRGLVGADKFLPYRHVRAFLAEGGYQLNTPRSDEGLVELVKQLCKTCDRMLPLAESAAPVSVHQERALLATLQRKLLEIKQAGVQFDRGLKDLCGDVAIPEEPYTIWAHFADAPDTDTARLAFFQIARYLVVAQRDKHRGLDDMVSDLLDVLEELKLAG